MNTVLITGCSSGYGLETARHFHAQGWRVIASMRRDGHDASSVAVRARRSGVIINVTSSVTLTPMPLVSVYTASKTAIAGFTGSLAQELDAFNVRVKLVEPGYGPTTRFTQNSDTRIEDAIPAPYMPFAAPIFAAFAQPAAVTTEVDVAEAVWRAATDMSNQLHYPAGPDAVALAKRRWSGHL